MTRGRKFMASLPSRRGFTLIELLVVITILFVIATVTLLSLPRIVESVNFASATTRVTGALGAAQTAAAASRTPTGVAFLYDTQSGVYTLLPLQRLNNRATLTKFPSGPAKQNFAQAFGPLPGAAPVELPPGMGVFGLAFNHIDPELLATSPSRTCIDRQGSDCFTEGWYSGEIFKPAAASGPIQDRLVNPWLFPRNDPRIYFDPENGGPVDEIAALDPWDPEAWRMDRARMIKAVRHANSFFVMFAEDGSFATSFAQGDNNDPPNAYIEFPDLPVDPDFTPTARRPDPVAFDDDAVFDPEFRGNIRNDARAPNPEVVLRTVSQLAVVNLKRLVEETGAPSPWLLHPSTSRAPWPDRRLELSTGDVALSHDDAKLDIDVVKVSQWIDLNAEIIAFNRYTGQAMRR